MASKFLMPLNFIKSIHWDAKRGVDWSTENWDYLLLQLFPFYLLLRKMLIRALNQTSNDTLGATCLSYAKAGEDLK